MFSGNLEIRPVILGNFGPPTLSCLRSWGRQGWKVGMIYIGAEGDTLPDSVSLDASTLLPREKLFNKEGADVIRRFIEAFHATSIIGVDEAISHWINDHRQEFSKVADVFITESHILQEVLSKKKQIEVATRVGLRVLPTYFLDKNPQSWNIIPDEKFPLCLRPSNPGGLNPSFKVHIAHTKNQVIEFLSKVEKFEKPIVAQPFKVLPNLVVHGARTPSGESIGLQAFLVERKFEGVTLTIRPWRLDEDLREKCIAFTDEFALTGNYHFEFLVDTKTNEAFFLEINNRLGGTTAKVYKCGYDEPLLALKAYGINGKGNMKIRNVTVASKQALLKYLYYTMTNRLTPLDYPTEAKWLRILKTLWGLFVWKDDVFSWRDLRGTMALYLGNLRVKLGGRKGGRLRG